MVEKSMIKNVKKHISGVLTILLSFAPWIAYSLITGGTLASKEAAVITAVVLSVALNFDKLKKGFVLDWGTIIFFILLGGCIFLFPNLKFLQYTGIISDLVVALIVAISIILRKPFTIQYAKESVPKYLWQAKGFIKVNYTITFAWGVSFLLITLFQFFSMMKWWGPNAHVIAEVIVYVLIIEFTKRYPSWYRAKRYWDYRKGLKPLNTRFLEGACAPVRKEIFAEKLEFQGEIPKALNGIYMRNGPNPEFEPFSYHYPFDGDAMIHALYFKNGQVDYRNKFVITPELKAERRYGQAIYPSVLDSVKPDPKLLAKDHAPEAKDGAFIHVLKLGEQYLAMHEASPAYQITEALATVGKWHPKNNETVLPINAHARIDPDSRAMYAINYSIGEPPYLTLYHLDKEGNLLKSVDIDKDYPTMIHDFIITENFVVIIDSPIVFSLEAAVKGESALQWHPEEGTKIGLISRKDLNQKPIWIKTEPFFAFHYANAFEKNGKIEFVGAHSKVFETPQNSNVPTQLTKTVIDINTQKVEFNNLDIEGAEFMRINDAYQGKPYRYIYTPVEVDEKYSKIAKYDDVTNERLVREFPGYELSEAVFVANENAQSEDDGYVIFFAYHDASDTSEFYILKAQDFLGKPQAVIQLPQRVPNGLHGNFFAASNIGE